MDQLRVMVAENYELKVKETSAGVTYFEEPLYMVAAVFDDPVKNFKNGIEAALQLLNGDRSYLLSLSCRHSSMRMVKLLYIRTLKSGVIKIIEYGLSYHVRLHKPFRVGVYVIGEVKYA